MTFAARRATFAARDTVADDLSHAVTERQITRAPYNHVLTNAAVWSADGRWLVYDTRSPKGFDGTRIERVNVDSGVVEVLCSA